MCGIEHAEKTTATHKEARLARVKREENDMQKRVATFDSGLLSNPLHIPNDRADREDLVPLSNLVNRVVLPEPVAISLLGASELGGQYAKRHFSKNPKQSNHFLGFSKAKHFNVQFSGKKSYSGKSER